VVECLRALRCDVPILDLEDVATIGRRVRALMKSRRN